MENYTSACTSMAALSELRLDLELGTLNSALELASTVPPK
jgi:hypothetical protein